MEDDSKNTPQTRDTSALRHSGSSKTLLRATEWRDTALGPLEKWPAELATAANIALGATKPMAVCWGSDRALLHNPAWAALFGHQDPAAMGQPFQIAMPELWKGAEQAIEEAMTSGRGTEVELEHCGVSRESGNENISLEFSCAPILTPENRTGGLLCAATNTTAQRRVHKEKVFAEAIVETIHTPLLVLQSNLTVESANPQFYKQFKVDEAQTLGRTIYELGNGQWDIPELHVLLEKILPADDSFYDYEVHHDFEDVGERIMMVNARRLDHVQKILLGIEDVTERRRAEASLRETEKRFRMLVEQIRDYAIFMIDLEGRGKTWNEGVGKTMGFDEAEFVGLPLAEAIYTPEAREAGAPSAELEDAAANGSSGNDRWMQRKDGSRFWASGITTCLVDDDGKLIGFMKVMRDLTEQKRLEDDLKSTAFELSAGHRKKDEFLALLAHELRNPLAAIRTSVELIKMAHDDPKIVAEARRAIGKQTDHLVVLVNDLLDLARVTRGKLQLRKSRVGLADIARSAVEGSRHSIEERNHQLIVDYPEQDIVLHADATRITQVIANLLNNAAKYTPDGGQVRLSVERESAVALISIRDTGIGIPPDLKDRIFEMFEQIDHPTQHANTGLGIGLTLVKSLVELHGGSIEVQSEGTNQGSAFFVRLPVEKAGTVDPGSESRVDRQLPTQLLRVLVVDDNVAAARMLSLLVKQLGHEVQTAHDGESALKAAKSYRPEVVLMDIGMPVMNGYEAARAIREQPWGQGIALVALTGWGTDEDRRKSRDAGFDQHLVKPAELSQLQSALQRLAPVPENEE